VTAVWGVTPAYARGCCARQPPSVAYTAYTAYTQDGVTSSETAPEAVFPCMGMGYGMGVGQASPSNTLDDALTFLTSC
jgi:hypothetical protein